MKTGTAKKSKDKAGIQSGTTHIQPIGPQDSGMDSSAKSQKPLANPSTKAAGGHVIK